ncbi:MAG: hypothetical protein K6G16_03950 [Lachnospiraceae bacterium]|nr:hypothetical protein [Lachnospiraceae bacterium]
MTRQMIFKMERTGLLDEGEHVTLTEGVLPSSYYYTLDAARARSLAMSPNVPFTERLRSGEGIVRSIEENERGFYVTVEIEE